MVIRYHMTPARTFRRQLRSLHEAYIDACARPRERWHQADATYRRLGADIENFGGESEEDRWRREDMEHDCEQNMAAAESTLELIRHAFAVSLFHFWERWVVHEMRLATVARDDLSDANKLERIERLDYRHDRVIGFLRSHGLSPDPRRLRTLQLAANVAKHAAGKGQDVELLRLRPDLFETRHWAHHRLTTYELRIPDGFFEEMLEAVRVSGPQAD